MRVVERRDGKWCVQYGYYEQRQSSSRFLALAEWPADDLRQAHSIAAREKINVALCPLPVDAQPLPQKPSVARAIREAPLDVREIVRRALAGLTDPLPTPEQSHEEMGVPCPQPKAGGRSYYLYLPEPVYGRLCAMAVAADVTRNRIIEALILSAEAGSAEAEG